MTRALSVKRKLCASVPSRVSVASGTSAPL
jgi:hypothetical protein